MTQFDSQGESVGAAQHGFTVDEDFSSMQELWS